MGLLRLENDALEAVRELVSNNSDLRAANRALERMHDAMELELRRLKGYGNESREQLIEDHNAMKKEVELLRVRLAKAELERASALAQRDELAKVIG